MGRELVDDLEGDIPDDGDEDAYESEDEEDDDEEDMTASPSVMKRAICKNLLDTVRRHPAKSPDGNHKQGFDFMSSRGRCFRSQRRTVARKKRQGLTYDPHPVRYKVPAKIRAFLRQGSRGLRRTTIAEMGAAIQHYIRHQQVTGQGGRVLATG